MHRNRQPSMGGPVILFLVLLNAIVLKKGYIDSHWYEAAYLTLPLLLIIILISVRQTFKTESHEANDEKVIIDKR